MTRAFVARIVASCTLLSCTLLSCTEGLPSEPTTAVDRGRALFASTASSPSSINPFSCSSCHVTTETPANDRALPGAPLGGVTKRTTYWGGKVDDLLVAVNACRTSFMTSPTTWIATDSDARDLFAYLDTLPGSGNLARFTFVESTALPPAGDKGSGAALYARTCANCHGDKSTANGRTAPRAPAIPDQVNTEHNYLTPADRRTVFVEKVRHGPFLGYGGNMPPFSAEALSDADLGAILAYLGIYD